MRNNEGGAEMSTPVHEAADPDHRGHQSLLTPGDLDAAQAQVDDCLFRMLEPHEVAAGMAFPADYQWLGNRRERVEARRQRRHPTRRPRPDRRRRRRPDMTRPTGRRRAPLALVWLLAVVLAVVAGGCGVVPPLPAPVAPGPVGAQLEALTVVPRPRDDGTYRRAAFGRAWADVEKSGCRQRVICKPPSG